MDEVQTCICCSDPNGVLSYHTERTKKISNICNKINVLHLIHYVLCVQCVRLYIPSSEAKGTAFLQSID